MLGKIPYFIPGFVLTAILSTWIIPTEISEGFTLAGKLMMLPLLASVGFFINKESMKSAGGPILIVGVISTICMLISSYLTIIIFT